MLKYFTLILFSIFVNGEFVKTVPLKNAKIINSIIAGGQSIKINKTILEDEIIFSETRQDMLLGSFILKRPSDIGSFRIRYTDGYGNSRNKLVNFSKGGISNNQLYFYEKKDYFYKYDDGKAKKENLIFEANLPISYVDKGAFLDISFKKCGGCDEVRFDYWDKRVIFYFKFKARNDKEINLSPNIKRIQIANKKGKYPTWLIVEAKEKIRKIEKLNDSGEKEITYRIYLD